MGTSTIFELPRSANIHLWVQLLLTGQPLLGQSSLPSPWWQLRTRSSGQWRRTARRLGWLGSAGPGRKFRCLEAWTGTMWHRIGAVASLLGVLPSYRVGEWAGEEVTGTCWGWSHQWLQCQQCLLFGSWCSAVRSCCSCTGSVKSVARKIRWHRLHHRIQRNLSPLPGNCGCNYYFWIDYCTLPSWVSLAWVAGWLLRGGWAAGRSVFSSRCCHDRMSSPLHTGTFRSLSSTCKESSCSSSARHRELSCQSSWAEAERNKIYKY